MSKMKQGTRLLICAGLSALMLFGAAACGKDAQSGEIETSEVVREDSEEPIEDTVSYQGILFDDAGKPLPPLLDEPPEGLPLFPAEETLAEKSGILPLMGLKSPPPKLGLSPLLDEPPEPPPNENPPLLSDCS